MIAQNVLSGATGAHQPVAEQAAHDSGAKAGSGLGLCDHDGVGDTCTKITNTEL